VKAVAFAVLVSPYDVDEHLVFFWHHAGTTHHPVGDAVLCQRSGSPDRVDNPFEYAVGNVGAVGRDLI
jgi:hypothetical protein